jgi:hypothetical protein
MPKTKRYVALGVLTLALFGVAISVATNVLGDEDDSSVSSAQARYRVMIPDLCRMKSELKAGRNTDAYNSFYRRAHPALHTLVTRLQAGNEPNRQLSGRVQIAKTTVEAGVITYPPSLRADLDSLIALAGESLVAINAGLPTSCADASR